MANIAKPLPDAEDIRRLFLYDPNLGCLRFASGSKAGAVAGSAHPCGYRQVRIGRSRFLVHRLIWKFHHGSEPRQVDHIDGNRSNSKIENLRAACEKTNQRNRGKQGNNTSGYKGAYFRKSDGRWMSAICLHGKQKHLGYFPNAAAAHAAYCAAAKEFYGEFANFGAAHD
jgi:hypothetical protein